jgi:alpha-beta hydrolase superfamily lysophospholipase
MVGAGGRVVGVDLRRRRYLSTLAAAGLGLGVSGAAGIGWYYSSLLLDTTLRPIYPERVLAADARTVTLVASRLAAQPGIWGLRWPAGLAVLGPVCAIRGDALDRPVLDGPIPGPGTWAAIDAGPFDPDPAARGLAFEEVRITTPLGDCPAWWVPAGGQTWVVMVHGRGGSRREALRVLPTLHGAGHPVLVTTYRNDTEAPASPDGHYHLGDTEWIDVEAAVRWARDRGARRVVLYGWSMGAAIIGAFLDRSDEADSVAAVIWDAPLVDWRITLREQARMRRLPGGLTALATAVTSRRIGIDFDRFDLIARPPARRPPALIVHSTEDTLVPVAGSRALAAAAGALDWPIRMLEVPGTEHTGAWNADPAAYEQAVAGFLSEVLN